MLKQETGVLTKKKTESNPLAVWTVVQSNTNKTLSFFY